MQQLFLADKTATSIKSQVCDVVQTILTTVHQIYTVFYGGDQSKRKSEEQDGEGGTWSQRKLLLARD